ncbi:MAG: hypothetical protein AVDCRST_MAG03-701, partial [uncultured Rubrobacteraceae bacterium]
AGLYLGPHELPGGEPGGAVVGGQGPRHPLGLGALARARRAYERYPQLSSLRSVAWSL